jgi:hypothetical protein
MDLLWETLRNQGYDPACPTNIAIWTPSTPEDVYDMRLEDKATSDDDVHVLLMTLIGA